MVDEEAPPDYSLAALVLGILAWLTLLFGFFTSPAPFFYLLVATGLGVTALVLGLRTRKASMGSAGAGLGGAAAAGAVAGQAALLAAALVWVVYATGLLVVLAVLYFVFLLWFPPQYASSGGSSCSCGDCSRCCEPCTSCASCDCGHCGGCGSCGGCGGGGCGCVSLLGATALAGAATRALPHLAGGRFAHHPDAPEFAQDVYVVRGERYCIGCFTTYPVLISATLVVAFVGAPPFAFAWGAALALAQLVSAA